MTPLSHIETSGNPRIQAAKHIEKLSQNGYYTAESILTLTMASTTGLYS